MSLGKRRLRDYNTRQYGNPLFRGSAARRGRNASVWQTGAWKRPALVTIGALAVSVFAWYLLWSPSFHITHITIEGATAETELRVAEILDEHRDGRVLFIFPRRAIFLFDTRGAKAAIEREFHLESLSIEKHLPGTVTVSVVEIPKRAVLYADGTFFAISETGTVIHLLTGNEIREIRDLPDAVAAGIAAQYGAQMIDVAALDPALADAPTRAAGAGFPLIFDGSTGSHTIPDPGVALFSRQTMALILQAHVRLPDIAGSPVRWFTVRERDEAVDVELQAGWNVYLATSLPFEIQGERLAALLRERSGTDRSRLEYVDLRYGERVFFKMRDNE